MASEDIIKVEGVIEQLLPGTLFKVKISGHDRYIVAHVSGKMRKNNIKVLLGDRVDLELSPYDMTKGRISFRHR